MLAPCPAIDMPATMQPRAVSHPPLRARLLGSGWQRPYLDLCCRAARCAELVGKFFFFSLFFLFLLSSIDGCLDCFEAIDCRLLSMADCFRLPVCRPASNDGCWKLFVQNRQSVKKWQLFTATLLTANLSPANRRPAQTLIGCISPRGATIPSTSPYPASAPLSPGSHQSQPVTARHCSSSWPCGRRLRW